MLQIACKMLTDTNITRVHPCLKTFIFLLQAMNFGLLLKSGVTISTFCLNSDDIAVQNSSIILN